MFKFLKKFRKTEADRRRFERLDPEETFLVEFRKQEGQAFRIGEGSDISQGGMRFLTSAPVHKGENLSVILYFPKQFPGPRKIEGEATVRRAYNPGATHRRRVACEFAETQPMLHQAVTNYMTWIKAPALSLS